MISNGLITKMGRGVLRKLMDKEYFQPEVVELKMDGEGNKKWYLFTRDGPVPAGHSGNTLELSVDHFNVGTRIELLEPIIEEKADA